MEIDGVKIIAKAAKNHRMAIVFRGKNISDDVSDTDPHENGKPILESKPVYDEYDKDDEHDVLAHAVNTASLVNKLSDKAKELFAKHPINKEREKKGLPLINCLLLRGAGEMPRSETFENKHNLKSCCIAGSGLYKGIARFMSMDVIEVKGATGKADTNVEAKIKAAHDAMEKDYGFVFVHIKAADSLAETGEFEAKRDFLEKVDKAFLPLIDHVEKRDYVVAITGDHTTASDIMRHTADSVPILVGGFGVRTDDNKQFGERPCQHGGLGHVLGRYLMDMLLDLSGQSPLWGN